jgi:hypothetical protein
MILPTPPSVPLQSMRGCRSTCHRAGKAKRRITRTNHIGVRAILIARRTQGYQWIEPGLTSVLMFYLHVCCHAACLRCLQCGASQLLQTFVIIDWRMQPTALLANSPCSRRRLAWLLTLHTHHHPFDTRAAHVSHTRSVTSPSLG